MKKFICVVIMLVFLVPFAAYAEAPTVKLPDGTEVVMEGLDDDEQAIMLRYINKIAKAKAAEDAAETKASKVVAEVVSDPEKLDSWRKVITGTIRDVCNDLNVSVNEFIKTPAGFGVAALLIYKVAGKDLLSAVADVILIVPFWFVMMGILWFLQRKYLSSIVIYERKREWQNDKGKTITEYLDAKHTTSYPWNSKDARTTFACVLYGSMIIFTITALVVVL